MWERISRLKLEVSGRLQGGQTVKRLAVFPQCKRSVLAPSVSTRQHWRFPLIGELLTQNPHPEHFGPVTISGGSASIIGALRKAHSPSTLAASDKGVDGVLVANLNRPGANVTGICQLSRADDKTIAMLYELIAMLQRLALCYCGAGLAFVWLGSQRDRCCRRLVVLTVSLLVGYWAMLVFIPVPGFGAGDFAEGHNLTNWLDTMYLPFRKWDGDHDPEGLLST